VNEIKKAFALKSAQDRERRTSEKGKMFGFESLLQGQEFIFSVQFDNESLVQNIVDKLVGAHRLGKSKNAAFSQIHVAQISGPEIIKSFDLTDKVLVYAQSNLYFVDTYGMPTFQPTAEQLGLVGGEVDYGLSQIRTHIYSPWNFKRNTSNTQRNCIAKGSVFVVNRVTKKTDTNVVRVFQAEGFGKVLYNPAFLEGNADATSKVHFIKSEKKDAEPPQAVTTLSKYLSKKLVEKSAEIAISKTVHGLVYSDEDKIRRLKKISSSQWGGIRAYATNAKSIEVLEKQLFDKEEGYLIHSVADENFVAYKLNLESDSFFVFSEGFGDDKADNRPLEEEVMIYKDGKIDFEKQTIIPATSIKGAISHRVAFHYNKLKQKYADQGEGTVGVENYAVSLLFGHAGQDNTGKAIDAKAGNVFINDMYYSKNQIDNSKILNHVAIDRFTGGAMDSALFSEKISRIKSGGFNLEIFISKSTLTKDDEVKHALEETLMDICKGLLPLGGMTTKGHGIFTGSLISEGRELFNYSK
jgi:CRISPR/Cas system CSM-associated protein Csm3 (group 7 of RAMP superfamily)